MRGRACERACVGVRACGVLLGRFCAGVRACERAHLMLQRESGTDMPVDARRCGGDRRRTKACDVSRRTGGRSESTRVLIVQRALHRGGGAGTVCSTSIQDTRSPESTTLWHPQHTPAHPPPHTHPPRMHSVQHKYRMAETRTIRMTPAGLSKRTVSRTHCRRLLPGTRRSEPTDACAHTRGPPRHTPHPAYAYTETLPPPRTRRRRTTLTMKRASTDCRRHACVLVCSYFGMRPR